MMGKIFGVTIILAFALSGGVLVHLIAVYIGLAAALIATIPVCLAFGLYSGYLAALVDRE